MEFPILLQTNDPILPISLKYCTVLHDCELQATALFLSSLLDCRLAGLMLCMSTDGDCSPSPLKVTAADDDDNAAGPSVESVESCLPTCLTGMEIGSWGRLVSFLFGVHLPPPTSLPELMKMGCIFCRREYSVMLSS